MSEGTPAQKRLPLSVILVAAFLTMTPAVYVLSIGPAQTVVNLPQLQPALELFYAPLTYVMSHSETARRWIEAYSELWR
jgi:hypothetical protein